MNETNRREKKKHEAENEIRIHTFESHTMKVTADRYTEPESEPEP